MIYPIQDRNVRISSSFGTRKHPVTGVVKLHNGIDLAVSENTPIIAPADGIVSGLLNNSAGGKQMLIEHGNGLRTGYAHMNQRNFQTGDKVKQGQVIGLSGATGNVTGAHLHFTVKQNGEYLDPAKINYQIGNNNKRILNWILLAGALGTTYYIYKRNEKTL